MSLHTLANHIQSAGRGDDKVLVHMTPGEVGGLQSLAMAHGGSLTINPQTGLPEAGFLSSLLPMLAGGALTVMSGGALSPLMAAGLVGGGTAVATGSLKKGLMAGLGAYGGAGLGAGLSSMGTAAPTAATPALNVATPTASGAPLGVEGLKTNLYGPGQGVFSTATPSPATGLSAYTAPTAQFDISKSLAQANMPTGVVAPPTPFANAQPAMAGATNVMRSLPTEATVESASLAAPQTAFDKLGAGVKKTFSGGMQGFKDLYAASEAAAPYSGVASLGSLALGTMDDKKKMPATDAGMIRPYTYERTQVPGAYDMGEPIYSATPGSSKERTYFTDKYTALTPYKAPGPEYAAEGGLMGLAVGGPVEMMSAQNAVGDNTMYPQSQLQTPMYSNPAVQRPMPTNVISQGIDAPVDSYTGEPKFAAGGISHLGDYSDGGRLLKGPGDGVSDSIPASIGNRQPARLADGEFVVPARIVSEIGNGSTEAGARKLYAMMDRVQKARRKTVGKDQVARNTKAEKLLPA